MQGLYLVYTLFINISEKMFYVGCYNCHPNDTLTPWITLGLTSKQQSPSMTLGKCIKHCRGHGQKFVALDYGMCWCLNKWPHEPLKLSDSHCKRKCIGEQAASWTCGGGWRASVYSIR